MISTILLNFATIPDPWNNHIRFDIQHGTKDYSAGLQVWIRHNSDSLKKQSMQLLAKHLLPAEALPRIKRPYKSPSMAKNIVRFR